MLLLELLRYRELIRDHKDNWYTAKNEIRKLASYSIKANI